MNELFGRLNGGRVVRIVQKFGPSGIEGAANADDIGAIICHETAPLGQTGRSEASHNIIKEARGGMEFYWHRDKAWPYAGARLALISKPQGGFATSYAVDPVPKPAVAPR
jgi:hypothetical protein